MLAVELAAASRAELEDVIDRGWIAK